MTKILSRCHTSADEPTAHTRLHALLGPPWPVLLIPATLPPTAGLPQWVGGKLDEQGWEGVGGWQNPGQGVAAACRNLEEGAQAYRGLPFF